MERNKYGRNVLVKNKIVPAILTAIAVSVLVYVLYHINFDVLYGHGASAILFASFGSSAFLLFMTPRSKSARVSAFVKSYLLSALIGAFGFYSIPFMPLYVIAGIVVFAVSMLMYVLDIMHPPAVGIAVAFILYRISGFYGVLIVLIGIAIFVFIRLVLERFVFVAEKDIIKEIKEIEH